jgi:hypothetical protein
MANIRVLLSQPRRYHPVLTSLALSFSYDRSFQPFQVIPQFPRVLNLQVK